MGKDMYRGAGKKLKTELPQLGGYLFYAPCFVATARNEVALTGAGVSSSPRSVIRVKQLAEQDQEACL